MALGSGEKAGLGDWGGTLCLEWLLCLCQGTGGSRLGGKTGHVSGQLGVLGLVGGSGIGTRLCTGGRGLWAWRGWGPQGAALAQHPLSAHRRPQRHALWGQFCVQQLLCRQHLP